MPTAKQLPFKEALKWEEDLMSETGISKETHIILREIEGHQKDQNWGAIRALWEFLEQQHLQRETTYSLRFILKVLR